MIKTTINQITLSDKLMCDIPFFKIGDTFTTQFDYYEKGEIVTHTITRIDFSMEEADEVVYWDDKTHVYITESELFKYKASTKQIPLSLTTK